MGTYLITASLIFGILLAGILVDRGYRRFAAHNPHLGPFRKTDGGCGCCAASESCADKSCGH